jgi:uncharacterized protein YodC (DUF2158 family)
MIMNVGDVVILKSGGPEMTIIRLSPQSDGSQWVRCAWFDQTPDNLWRMETEDFPVESLEAQ